MNITCHSTIVSFVFVMANEMTGLSKAYLCPACTSIPSKDDYYTSKEVFFDVILHEVVPVTLADHTRCCLLNQ